MSNQDILVETDWLASRLEAPDIKILDATCFMPSDPRNPLDCHYQARIPGARYFDINEVADITTGLSHSLPKPEVFMSKVSRLGVGDGLKIVIYDANGGNNAAMRAWWMFRHYGHTDVAVLNGGLPKWIAESKPLADGKPTKLLPRDYRYFTPRKGIATAVIREDIFDNITSQKAIIVDARAAARYAGETPEPRPSLHLGHVPGARNLPHTELINPDFTLKTVDEIQTLFASAGVPLDDTPVVATCGTGVTACVIAFAATLAGKPNIAIYDGSWEDWGNTPDLPVQTGLTP